MSWDTDMVTFLRVLINDPNGTTYAEASVIKTLLVAAYQVKLELSFDQNYSINIENETLSPDPTLTATKDESYVNLVCLKAAAIADRGSAILAARRAIAVKDGSSSIDLRAPLQGWLSLLEKGWNAVYDKAKLEYQLGNGTIAGAAVMTPFRTYASSYDDCHRSFGNYNQ